MALRMENDGEITSIDKSRQRLSVLNENAKRLGINIIKTMATDMFNIPSENVYDRVLLDPPCSGWGTAGKHSDLRWAKTPDDVRKLGKIQLAMLNKASKLVKPGGVLIYSTCSIMRAENDDIVEAFLEQTDEFEVESGAAFLPGDVVDERGYVKTYPSFTNLDGAFAARLRRKA
jgi:16S rRNA (cytosine967-C5)-methyltransferase